MICFISLFCDVAFEKCSINTDYYYYYLKINLYTFISPLWLCTALGSTNTTIKTVKIITARCHVFVGMNDELVQMVKTIIWWSHAIETSLTLE